MAADRDGGVNGTPGQPDDGPARRRLQSNTPCPFCGSSDTEKQSDFGTSLMVRLHYCRSCHTSFEVVKWGDNEGLDLPGFLVEGRGDP